jgi:minor fimbrial subunit
MENTIKCSALALVVMAIGYNIAIADPVNINITGNVVAAPCTVNNGNSNLNVDLGTNILASSLATAGSGTILTPFNLALTACPAGTNSVTVTFMGTADSTSASMYRNTGTASNLAVELSQQTTGTILGNGSMLTQMVQADRTVTYALNARAYTAMGSVAPGTINAVVQADFTYN